MLIRTRLLAVGLALAVQAPLAPSVFTQTPRPAAAPADYAGAAACARCHASHAQTYELTAHRRTSALADAQTIKGSIPAAGLEMPTRNPDIHLRVETAGGVASQLAKTPGGEQRESIDVVTGSGRKGQTYLFWSRDALFELPISYLTESRRWINSPGYSDGQVHFDRPIVPRCLECHASRVRALAPPNHYDRASLVTGLDCEKCHGPGGAHVRGHDAQQADAPRMLNPRTLTRNAQLDICGACHSKIVPMTPSFSYQPGDPLDAHFQRAGGVDLDEPHGNQIAQLKASRCFVFSKTMTCSSCHDVHREQRDVAALAKACLGCHQMERCGQFKKEGRRIANRCIDCHMPLANMAAITIEDRSGAFMPQGRSHRIRIIQPGR